MLQFIGVSRPSERAGALMVLDQNRLGTSRQFHVLRGRHHQTWDTNRCCRRATHVTYRDRSYRSSVIVLPQILCVFCSVL